MVQGPVVNILIKGALSKQTIKHIKWQNDGGMWIIQQEDSYLWVLNVHTY